MYFISSHLFMLYCLVFKLIIKVVVTLLFDHDRQPINLWNGTVFKTLLFHLLHEYFWFPCRCYPSSIYVCVNDHVEMYSYFLIKCLLDNCIKYIPTFLLLHILGVLFFVFWWNSHKKIYVYCAGQESLCGHPEGNF
jgi:hypothetical protein